MKGVYRGAWVLFLFLTAAFAVWGQDAKPDALKMYANGQYEQAIVVCRQELAVTPRNMDSYTVLGWSLLALNRYQEALVEADKALTINDGDVRVIKIKGEALYYLNRYSEALVYLQRYVAFLPGQSDKNMASVYYLMGEIYIKLGQYENADIALSTAVYMWNNQAAWWVRLGYAREMKKDYQYALIAYNRALQLAPDLPAAQKGVESVKQKIASQ